MHWVDWLIDWRLGVRLLTSIRSEREAIVHTRKAIKISSTITRVFDSFLHLIIFAIIPHKENKMKMLCYVVWSLLIIGYMRSILERNLFWSVISGPINYWNWINASIFIGVRLFQCIWASLLMYSITQSIAGNSTWKWSWIAPQNVRDFSMNWRQVPLSMLSR